MLERLQKVVAAAGVASRRDATTLIEAGRIQVNGEVVREPGRRVDPAQDTITVDGNPLARDVPHLYILLNKPRGYVTTREDPNAAQTVMELVLPRLEARYGAEHPAVTGLHPVGRLDTQTEGLLVLTNDGELTHLLTHPRHRVPKLYQATVRGIPDREALDQLRTGIPLFGHRTLPARVRLGRVDRGRETAQIEIELREGRQQQVRRMLQAVGYPVRDLRRVAIGDLSADRLKVGQWRFLSEGEVAGLRRASELGPEGPVSSPGEEEEAAQGLAAHEPGTVRGENGPGPEEGFRSDHGAGWRGEEQPRRPWHSDREARGPAPGGYRERGSGGHDRYQDRPRPYGRRDGEERRGSGARPWEPDAPLPNRLGGSAGGREFPRDAPLPDRSGGGSDREDRGPRLPYRGGGHDGERRAPARDRAGGWAPRPPRDERPPRSDDRPWRPQERPRWNDSRPLQDNDRPPRRDGDRPWREGGRPPREGQGAPRWERDRPERGGERPRWNENRPPRSEDRPPRRDGDRPWHADSRPPRGEARPWRDDNRGPRSGERPRQDGPPRGGDRPWRDGPQPPRGGDRPWRDGPRPPRGEDRPPRREGERPWRDDSRPARRDEGPPRRGGERPWQNQGRPAGRDGDRPRGPYRPAGDDSRPPRRPWGDSGREGRDRGFGNNRPPRGRDGGSGGSSRPRPKRED